MKAVASVDSEPNMSDMSEEQRSVVLKKASQDGDEHEEEVSTNTSELQVHACCKSSTSREDRRLSSAI